MIYTDINIASYLHIWCICGFERIHLVYFFMSGIVAVSTLRTQSKNQYCS